MPEQVYEQELKSLEQEAETAVTQGGERTLCYNIPPHLFMALLGLRCCARAFSSCDEQGLLFIVVHGFLTEVASLAAEHRL